LNDIFACTIPVLGRKFPGAYEKTCPPFPDMTIVNKINERSVDIVYISRLIQND